MKSVELKATSRSEVRNKSALKSLRKEGRVPAVIYGAQDNINFHVDEIAFTKLINTSDVYFIDIAMEDKTVKAVIKDVQFHPVTDKVIHIDFMEVVDDKSVTMGIPVVFTGKSIGVMNGGKRREKLRKILCKGLPKDLPEVISVEISHLKIGMDIKVKDIVIDNVELLNSPNAVVIAVKTSRVAVEEEEVEGEEGAEGEEAATEEAASE